MFFTCNSNIAFSFWSWWQTSSSPLSIHCLQTPAKLQGQEKCIFYIYTVLGLHQVTALGRQSLINMKPYLLRLQCCRISWMTENGGSEVCCVHRWDVGLRGQLSFLLCNSLFSPIFMYWRKKNIQKKASWTLTTSPSPRWGCIPTCTCTDPPKGIPMQ